jgi:peptidoglycan/LPS O-acetylase OafA/YrhL
MTSDLTSPKHQLIKPFYASFDGLRACAFLGVFSWHMSLLIPVTSNWLHWGWAGVDLFFVLSGFLITGILLDTVGKPHFFKNFYSRRALRTFPLYYSFWLVVLLLTPVLHFEWTHSVEATVFYVGNLFFAGANLGRHSNPDSMTYVIFGRHTKLVFSHFWSLGVEEQFYLVWPAIIWFVRSRRSLLALCLFGIVATPCLRLAIFHFHPEQLAAGGLYFSTYARCDTLLTGAALAIWLRLAGNISPVAVRRGMLAVLTCSLAALAALVRFDPHPGPLPCLDDAMGTIGFTLIAFAAGALLIYCLFENTWLSRLLQWQPLRAMGRISYGMYFFHGLLFVPLGPFLIMLRLHHLELLYPVIVFGITLVLAVLSFRFLESPFLRLKHGLAPRPGAIADPPPAFQQLVPEQAPSALLQPITMDIRS